MYEARPVIEWIGVLYIYVFVAGKMCEDMEAFVVQ